MHRTALSWLRGPLTAITFAATTALAGTAAMAGPLKVYSPYVERGELELESKGIHENDIDGGDENADAYRFSAGYGFTDFWFSEFAVELEHEGPEALKVESFEFENVFQLTPQGKYGLDFGMLAEIEVPRQGDDPVSLVVGPLVAKDIGRTVHIANILFEKQFGTNRESGVSLGYAWESRWRLNPYFEPGFDAFGTFGEIGNFTPASEQDHRIGPMFAGAVEAGRGAKISYALGVLFGLTHDSPDLSLNWRIEYSTRF